MPARDAELRPVFWMGSSRRDLKAFPEEVQDEMGWALRDAQFGGRRLNTRVLHGFRGASVLEVVDEYRGDAYRVVYRVRFPEAVYVIHAFQKKSKHGVETRQHERGVIDTRLRAAELHYHKHYSTGRNQ